MNFKQPPRPLIVSLAIAVSLGYSVSAFAADGIARCGDVDGVVVRVTPQFLVPGDDRPALPHIDVRPEDLPNNAEHLDGREIKVIASGPVLGSLDSQNIETALTCTEDGLMLTGHLVRSAAYDGNALRNILWRPHIEVVVVLHGRTTSFEAKFDMRLTNGVLVDHARSEIGGGNQTYPITVKEIIHAPM